MVSSLVLLAVGYAVGSKANHSSMVEKGWAAVVFASASAPVGGLIQLIFQRSIKPRQSVGYNYSKLMSPNLPVGGLPIRKG